MDQHAAHDDGPACHEPVVPRLFAVAGPLDPDDGPGAPFNPYDAVLWGLLFADHAFVYFRDPETHRHEDGVFSTAERARRFFSRGCAEPLRLVWL
ncbi:hypothetical protein F0L68_20730 [Solihabitans fulvus]|uniref:Uncharacterized protein n=1 Tax=Solihabitans fulvus TaxID=1892852 RepID=A0A5B2XAQ0_9PSEU|nr:hypothetical protein [Solihabitans fulvus]KAA2260151.1 hypothetical protein F0L68_20730 [Solihabitans fulvus]